MALRWAVCDLTGQIVADIDKRQPGARVDLYLNPVSQQVDTASLVLPFEEPAAAQCYPLSRVLKCWLDEDIVFAGPMLNPAFDLVARTVTINAVGPPRKLEKSFINDRSDTDFISQVGVFQRTLLADGVTEKDQSEIIAELMEHASPAAFETSLGVPGHGIIRGSLPVSQGRDLTYNTGDQIAQAIWDITQMDGGPDVSFTPVDRTDGVLCTLDTFLPHRGADKTAGVVFEFGFGFSNAAGLVWTPDGTNVETTHTTQGVSLEGSVPVRYRARQPDAQLLFGNLGNYEARSDVAFTATVTGIAKAACGMRAFPPYFIDLTPALDDGTGRVRDSSSGQFVELDGRYGQPPRLAPQGDYWIGDTITVRARDVPTVNLDVQGRVYQIALVEDADGSLVNEVKVSPNIDTSGVV